MSESRKKADWLYVASLVLAITFAPLALYLAGYFALSSRTDLAVSNPRANETVLRTFATEWQAKLYKPVEKLEERAFGKNVVIAWRIE